MLFSRDVARNFNCDLVPGLVADLFVDRLVRHDLEPAGSNRQEQQDTGAVFRPVHPQPEELADGAFARVFQWQKPGNDVNPQFPGGLAFGFSGGARDPVEVLLGQLGAESFRDAHGQQPVVEPA